jgi:hypothetical protein
MSATPSSVERPYSARKTSISPGRDPLRIRSTSAVARRTAAARPSGDRGAGLVMAASTSASGARWRARMAARAAARSGMAGLRKEVAGLWSVMGQMIQVSRKAVSRFRGFRRQVDRYRFGLQHKGCRGSHGQSDRRLRPQDSRRPVTRRAHPGDGTRAGVGLSKTPCQVRIRKLEAAGYIRGYRAIVDQARLGRNHITFVEVRLSTPGKRRCPPSTPPSARFRRSRNAT